jgi:hypothetical protein
MATYSIDEPTPEYFKVSLPTPEANVGPSALMSNLGGLLFGGADSGLNEYLSADQQKAMQRQAMMQAAMSLLKSGRTSTVPIGLGEAVADAYQAGTAGYQGAQQNAIQRILMKQKFDEAKRAQAAQEAYQKFLLGQPTDGGAITPEQAISAPVSAELPVGPTVERAAMIGQQMPAGVSQNGMNVLSQSQRALLAALPADKGIPEALKLLQPQETTGQAFKGADGKYYIQTKTGGVIPAPVAPEVKTTGMPQEAVVNGTPQLVQYYEDGSYKVVTGVSPKAPPSPHEIQLLRETGMPVTFENVQAIRKSAAANVNVDVGQKGFENKMSAKKTFMSEPIYKDFNDMKSAYGQVLSSLEQGTPIGDVAGATKVMKLLDPGSVVRESELGLAMSASGRMDRLKNYFGLWSSGRKLTPTQVDDFKTLSNELFAAAGQAYNQKRGEYIGFGKDTGVDLESALGSPAKLPSIVRQPGAGAAGGQRKPLGEIFKR